MNIYKVLYFKNSGQNIFISYSKSNYVKWGFDKPSRQGCCTVWALHLGKLHIESQTPNTPNELYENNI